MLAITDQSFENEVLKAPGLVMVDFWAPWCGPCKMTSPIVEQLAAEFQGKVVIGKMNVDENQKIPASHGIMSIPTFLFFKGGQVVDQVVGGVSKDVLKTKLEKYAS